MDLLVLAGIAFGAMYYGYRRINTPEAVHSWGVLPEWKPPPLDNPGPPPPPAPELPSGPINIGALPWNPLVPTNPLQFLTPRDPNDRHAQW